MYKTSITSSHRLNGTGLGRSPRRSGYVVCRFDLRCTPTGLTRDDTLASGDGAKRTCRYEGNAHLTAISRGLRGERDLQKCFRFVASAELTKGTTFRTSTLADLEGSRAGRGSNLSLVPYSRRCRASLARRACSPSGPAPNSRIALRRGCPRLVIDAITRRAGRKRVTMCLPASNAASTPNRCRKTARYSEGKH